MKCPNCDFIERDELWGEPAICPKCDAIYEKAVKVKALRERLRESKKAKVITGVARPKAKQPTDGSGPQLSSAPPTPPPTRNVHGTVRPDSPVPPYSGETLYRADGTPVVLRSEKKSGCLRQALVFFGAILALAFLSEVMSSYFGYVERSKDPAKAVQHSTEQSSRRAKQAESDREFNIRSNAQAQIKDSLKDPYSAKFRNAKGRCGEVNSKNSFGAYTGFKRYIAVRPGVSFLDDGGHEFEALWTGICM